MNSNPVWLVKKKKKKNSHDKNINNSNYVL